MFGAHMQVELLNDGPVTFLLDSRREGDPPCRADGRAMRDRSVRGTHVVVVKSCARMPIRKQGESPFGLSMV